MSDQWIIYPDKRSAQAGVDEIDQVRGYPIVGQNAHTGEEDPTAQQTTTWAIPVELQDGSNQWGFQLPPDITPVAGGGTVEEYDPAWFPPPAAAKSAAVGHKSKPKHKRR